jgi:hypothetical protein
MRDPGASLELVIDSRVVFRSAGTWLHPLFELERFLTEHGMDAANGEVSDKVVGRGSAFLIVRLGIRRVHAVLLSRLGKDVLDRAGAATTWDRLVDEIECKTESILRHETDPEAAYAILKERAAGARAREPRT